MNAPHAFPFPLHWDAHDLAHAVPLRLHELPLFSTDPDGPDATSARTRPLPRRALRDGYGHGHGLAPFRVC